MNTVQISDREITILKIIVKIGGGTAKEIYNSVSAGSDFIAMLRIVHTLHRKDLLMQIRAGSESIYKASDKGLEVIK